MILNVDIWFYNSFENVIEYNSILKKKIGGRYLFLISKI